MVHISLVSTKANGVRYFPYTGYLGLTPVKIEGAVISRRDGDMKPLPSKSISISVRCYESRLGRIGTMQTNVLVDYTQVLWSKPDSEEYADIGDEEFPFRITIPSRVGGFSTASFVEYKCVWRIEAVLNHQPLMGVGSRQVKHAELPFFRYDLPSDYPFLPACSEPQLRRITTKARAPKIRYCINMDRVPVGPMDLVSIPLHLQPLDADVTVRGASVVVERRIQLLEPASLPSPVSPSFTVQSSPVSSSSSSSSTLLSSSAPASYQDSSSHLLASPSSSSLASSSPTVTPHSTHLSCNSQIPRGPASSSPPHSPLSHNEPHPIRTISHSIAATESTGTFSRSQDGIWHKTLTVQWPNTRTNGRWAIGETIKSDLISIRFFVRVKIVVTSSSGTDTLELDEEEIVAVSTNDAERSLALSKYNEAADAARSKSKSPRRTRREHHEAQPPVPSPTSSRTVPSDIPSSGPHRSSARRPHTSAGPRDKAHGFRGREGVESSERVHQPDDAIFRRRSARPEVGHRSSTEVQKPNIEGVFYPPRMTSNISGESSGSGSATASTVSGNSQQSDDVREWEKELARIEVQSKRSSDLLGFASSIRKKTRAIVDPPRLGRFISGRR